jgi:uncharacterized protein YecT (DUF1311 family)
MMRTMRLFILLLLFAYTSVMEAAPSFDCEKAKTDIEHAICKDERLSDLDKVLDKVYKQALRRSPHPEKIKREQMQWMKNRPNFDKRLENFLRNRENQDPAFLQSQRMLYERYRPNKEHADYERKLISTLGADYFSRIRKFLALKDQALCAFFLEEFLKNPEKVNQFKTDRILVCLAMIAFLEQTGESLDYNSFDEIADNLLFTKLTPNKILVLLNTSQGAYRLTYDFYTIDKATGTLNMKPYILSYDVGSNCNDGGNGYTGDFDIDFDKEEIRCCTRPVWYDMGECLTWKLTEHCGVLTQKR